LQVLSELLTDSAYNDSRVVGIDFNDAPHGFRFDDDNPIAPPDYLFMNTLSPGGGENGERNACASRIWQSESYQRSTFVRQLGKAKKAGNWTSKWYGNVTRIWRTRLLATPTEKAGMR
jgi:hypothetical protein